jgi:hypothetical protein
MANQQHRTVQALPAPMAVTITQGVPNMDAYSLLADARRKLLALAEGYKDAGKLAEALGASQAELTRLGVEREICRDAAGSLIPLLQSFAPSTYRR